MTTAGRVLLRRVWIVLALSSCEDFPNAPTSTVTLTPSASAPWPQELFNKEDSVITVDVKGADSNAITGLRLEWQSSDPSILEIQPDTSSHVDSLIAMRTVKIVAQRRGTATISVKVIQEGIEPATLGLTIRVWERWTAISAGYDHTCALTVDDDAYCWGKGPLGHGSAAPSAKPVRVGRDVKFASVAAGNGHSCGVLLDGTVQCWGSNSLGELGNGGGSNQVLPVPVSLVSTFVTVWAGSNYVCGVSGQQTGYCWGDNQNWQLGDAGVASPIVLRPSPRFDDCGSGALCSRTPRLIRDRAKAPVPLSAIAPGVGHTCALTPAGQALCWGVGSVELGIGVSIRTESTTATPFIPVDAGGTTFDEISSGLWHTCAIGASDRRVYCWGFNSLGQLGTTSPDSTCFLDPSNVGCNRKAKAVTASLRFASLDVGVNNTCGISEEAAAYCWGSNQFGQLGNPTLANTTTPVKIDSLRVPLVSLSVGSTHVCAVSLRGAAYCWGDSGNGKLGQEATANTGTVRPVRVDEPQ